MKKKIPKPLNATNNKELFINAGATFVMVVAAYIVYEKFIKNSINKGNPNDKIM